jgi:murein DD-endopeptidase MepM/ murein hydrolase activator NlpD
VLIPLITSLVFAVSPSSAWVAPVPIHVVRGFDRPTPNWLPGHRGVDLVASVGEMVRSAGAGTVLWAGPIAGRGVVVVLHSKGLRTTYEPVNSSVSAGDQIRAGDPIGRIGTGQSHCSGRCLHWGLRRGMQYLNPLLLLGLGHPRLIPPSSRST